MEHNILIVNAKGQIVTKVIDTHLMTRYTKSMRKYFKEGVRRLIPLKLRLMMVSILETQPESMRAAYLMEGMYRGMAEPYKDVLDSYDVDKHWEYLYSSMSNQYMNDLVDNDIITDEDMQCLEMTNVKTKEEFHRFDELCDGTKVKLIYLGGYIATLSII